MGEWDKDWLLGFCGDDRDNGIVKSDEDWELMEILFVIDWFWLRVLRIGDVDRGMDWFMFFMEFELDVVIEIIGEWVFLGDLVGAVGLVNVRWWSYGRSIEKLWMFRNWLGK